MTPEQETILTSLTSSFINGGSAPEIDRATAKALGLDLVAKNDYLGAFVWTAIFTFPIAPALEATTSHMRHHLHALSEAMHQHAEKIKEAAETAPNSVFKFLTENNDPTTTEQIGNTETNKEG